MPCGQHRLTQGWSYILRSALLYRVTEIWKKEDGCGKVYLSAGSTRDSSKSCISAVSVSAIVIVHQVHTELVMSHLVLLGYHCCQL